MSLHIFKINPEDFKQLIALRPYKRTNLLLVKDETDFLFPPPPPINRIFPKLIPFEVSDLYEWHAIVEKVNSDIRCKIWTNSTHTLVFLDYNDMDIPPTSFDK